MYVPVIDFASDLSLFATCVGVQVHREEIVESTKNNNKHISCDYLGRNTNIRKNEFVYVGPVWRQGNGYPKWVDDLGLKCMVSVNN